MKRHKPTPKTAQIEVQPRVARANLGLWISGTKKLWSIAQTDGTEVGKPINLEGSPPPPIPRKGLLGAEFAKSVCKILIADGLEVKILTTNELGPLSSDFPVLPAPQP